jgi:hypothetical protein
MNHLAGRTGIARQDLGQGFRGRLQRAEKLGRRVGDPSTTTGLATLPPAPLIGLATLWFASLLAATAAKRKHRVPIVAVHPSSFFDPIDVPLAPMSGAITAAILRSRMRAQWNPLGCRAATNVANAKHHDRVAAHSVARHLGHGEPGDWSLAARSAPPSAVSDIMPQRQSPLTKWPRRCIDRRSIDCQ